MSIRLELVDRSSSSGRGRSDSRAESIPINDQYDQLRDRYAVLQERLQDLKILDKNLRQEIQDVTREMLEVRDEYRAAMDANRRIETNAANDADADLYQGTPTALAPKLAAIDRHISNILAEIRRELTGAALASPGEEPKLRQKTAREKTLDGVRVDYAQAKDYNGKSIDELEVDFEELKKQREGLEFIGPQMLIMSIHAFGREKEIPGQIDNWRKLGTPDSQHHVSAVAGALESKAQTLINRIAFNILCYDARIKLLQKLEKAARDITLRANTADDKYSFAGPAGELDNVMDTLVELVMQALDDYGMLGKSTGADAFVRGVLSHMTGRSKPRNGQELSKLITIMLLTATMKADGTYSLGKQDVGKLRSMFFPDRFNAKIEALDLDDESKEKLKTSIVTFFKVADEVYSSKYFEK